MPLGPLKPPPNCLVTGEEGILPLTAKISVMVVALRLATYTFPLVSTAIAEGSLMAVLMVAVIDEGEMTPLTAGISLTALFLVSDTQRSPCASSARNKEVPSPLPIHSMLDDAVTDPFTATISEIMTLSSLDMKRSPLPSTAMLVGSRESNRVFCIPGRKMTCGPVPTP